MEGEARSLIDSGEMMKIGYPGIAEDMKTKETLKAWRLKHVWPRWRRGVGWPKWSFNEDYGRFRGKKGSSGVREVEIQSRARARIK